MANGERNQDGLPENLRRQLAVAVRSVQWSYAIFWSLSTIQEGELEWGEGYYNGDIKTRKTLPAMELKADKIGLQRSEQLRELYESLLEGETDQPAKRPSAALNPDDLSDAEWYYLVCMSFVFSPGEGLPGRALANGQTIWLCNAHCADSKIFSRSLLAKSASIQTVVCFPHFGGVIELGVTELVPEDPSLIQHIKTSLLELSKPVCSEKISSLIPHSEDDRDHLRAKVGHETEDTMDLEDFYSPTEDIGFDKGELKELGSNDDCSDWSQNQSWHFMDEDCSDCIQGSTRSSECKSQALDQEKSFETCKDEKVNDTKLSSLGIVNEDDGLHYRKTLSAIFRSSDRLLGNLSFQGCCFQFGFVCWKKGEIIEDHKPKIQQNTLKKILLDVPLMHEPCSHKLLLENGKKDQVLKVNGDEISIQFVAFPDKRMENESFLVLKSMVPSISKEASSWGFCELCFSAS